MKKKGNIQTIGEITKEALSRLSDNRCENCKIGLRHKDESGLRKWCERCIAAYKQKVTFDHHPERAEKIIIQLVEPLYYEAIIETLDLAVQNKLSQLQSGQDVFMHGAVGAGKTYAMAALIRQYVYEGYQCERVNFDDFCVKVRSTFSKVAKQTEEEIIEPLKLIGKLFIDDLGIRSKQETDFAYVTFYSLLNKRQERLLPTFISSNKTIEQLGQAFDSRIASRLQTAVVIEIKGKDRRASG